MYKFRTGLLTILMVLWITPVISQSNYIIDSLKTVAAETDNDTLRAKTYNWICYHYYPVDSDSSLHYALLARDFSRQKNLKVYESAALKHLGRCYSMKGQYHIGLKSIEEAMIIDEELGSEDRRHESLISLAIINRKLGNLEEAVANNLECLEHFMNTDTINDPVDLMYLILINNNIGAAYMDLKEYEKAWMHFKECLSRAKRWRDQQFMGGATRNMGDIYLKWKDKPDSALYFYIEAEKYERAGNNPMHIAEVNLGLANTYIALNRLSLARNALDTTEKYLPFVTSVGIEQELQRTYAAYYKASGNLGQALIHQENLIEMIDSTFTAMNNAAMAEFGIIYDMMKRENEISMLESETELHRFQKRVQLYTFIMTALIILIILYLVFSRLKKVARMKKDMAHQLNQRDRELTSNALSLIKRNEVMKGVSEKLKKSKLKLKPENQTLVQEVINEINLELSEVGWKEFELRFLKVHPDFYHNIRQEFPDITPAEIKLSALLRLNFTTKEVASITGLSNSSVETARVRLRKKLKLDSDTNLVGFLSRF